MIHRFFRNSFFNDNGTGQLVAAQFFFFASIGSYLPYAGVFLARLGFTGTEIGILLAINPLCRFLFSTIWAKVFIRSRNRMRFVHINILGASLSPLLLLGEPGFLRAFCMVLLFSLFRTGLIPMLDNLTMQHSSRTGVHYGRIRLVGSIGFIVSVFITGFLYDRFGSYGFVFTAMLFSFIMHIPAGKLDLESAAPRTENAGKVPWDANLAVFMAVMLVYAGTFSFYNNFFNVRIDELSLSQSFAGIAWCAGVAAEVVLMFFAGEIIGKIGARNLIALSMLMGLPRYLVTGMSDSVTLIFLANLLHGFCFGTFHVGALSYLRKLLPEESGLAVQSAYSMLVYGLGSIAGSWVSGMLFDGGGSQLVFVVAAGVSLVTAVAALKCRREE